MSSQCSREILQKQFYEWLAQNYKGEALEIIGIEQAASNWVAETGSVAEEENLTALSILLHCTQCGQHTRVTPEGALAMLADDPRCQVAPNPSIVPVYEFNQKF